VLQQATSLGSNDSWTDVLTAPIFSGGMNTVTFAISLTPLQVTRSGENLALEWIGSATLQKASSIIGPWTDVAAARSPHTVEPTDLAAFYRLSPQGFYRSGP
jgi:hypothetical protein